MHWFWCERYPTELCVLTCHSQLASLLWEVVELLGGKASLEMLVTRWGPWGFIALFLFLSALYVLFCQEPRVPQPTLVTMRSVTTVPSPAWQTVSLQTVSQDRSFPLMLLQLAQHGSFLHSLGPISSGLTQSLSCYSVYKVSTVRKSRLLLLPNSMSSYEKLWNEKKCFCRK